MRPETLQNYVFPEGSAWNADDQSADELAL
jgi:hypothetical protein